MKHLGDITKISGYDAPVVDCVIFGAPCQDLSVAGKRAGMKHSNLGDEEATRSGLFMEAVRIIKEMRTKDENERRCSAEFIRPRFAVYENVPGAFSSNKGEDFKIVLEELAKVIDKDAVIPMPPKGKWTNSGSIVGDGWSIAWRVLDGQFWDAPMSMMTECRLDSVHHSGVRESRLSQILEENAHPKYYLSARACEGILRRAEARGKELPPILKEALLQMIAREHSVSTDTINAPQEE